MKIKSNVTPKSRKDELVVQEFEGEILIYDLKTDKAVSLNSTSALVWQACDGSRNIAEITNFISKKLNSTVNEDLVWLALDQLKKEKLIENGSALENHFEGISRREVIKKIGLSSMVALPIVASLVAPLATYAQSACGGNCRCPNSTPDTGNCAGSTTPTTINCNNIFTPACDCRGPFGAPGSGGGPTGTPGFRTGMCST